MVNFKQCWSVRVIIHAWLDRLMKQLFGQWLLRYLILGILITGLAVALPVAQTASLHAPHATNSPSVPERTCSLTTCGAFDLAWTLLLFALTSLVASLAEPRIVFGLTNPLTLDPPPRIARA